MECNSDFVDDRIDENLPKFLYCREAFADFDPTVVAKMDENDVAAISASANKELKLAECRVRCVIENAKCIRKASSAPKNKNNS